MNIKTTIPASEARKELFKILEKLDKGHSYYTITQNGRPKAVVMSAEKFESWQETIEVMRDFPDLDKDIAEAQRDYENGDYITLEELLTEEGFIVADKSRKKYEIHSNNSKKGKKRNKKN